MLHRERIPLPDAHLLVSNHPHPPENPRAICERIPHIKAVPNKGDLVRIFPEGLQISRTAHTIKRRKGMERILARHPVSVIPIYFAKKGVMPMP